jgi:hypothetical protein
MQVKRHPFWKPSLGVNLIILFSCAAWGSHPSMNTLLATPGSSVALPTPAVANASPALRAGESLTFAIRWGAITGGYSSLSVQGVQTISGRPAYHVVAEARSTGLVDALYRVRDRNESWVGTQPLGTLRYAKNIHEGKYRVEEETVLNQDEHRFHNHSYRIDKNEYEDKEGSIPPNVLDVLGSLYYVRTLPLAVGQSYTIDVHSGDKVYPLVVNVKKRAKVKVRAGKFDCFLVEPQLRDPGIFISKGKKLEVWITADARHLPVLMRSEVFIGHVSAELVKQTTVPTSSMQLSQSRPSTGDILSSVR